MDDRVLVFFLCFDVKCLFKKNICFFLFFSWLPLYLYPPGILPTTTTPQLVSDLPRQDLRGLQVEGGYGGRRVVEAGETNATNPENENRATRRWEPWWLAGANYCVWHCHSEGNHPVPAPFSLLLLLLLFRSVSVCCWLWCFLRLGGGGASGARSVSDPAPPCRQAVAGLATPIRRGMC